MNIVPTGELKYCVGKHVPLGVSVEGKTVNFAVSVRSAKSVVLKLKDKGEITELVLDGKYRKGSVFAVAVSGLSRDFAYCYEAFDKCFADPYARGFLGRSLFGIPEKGEPWCRGYVSLNANGKKEDAPLGIPLSELIIYKLHVRGFTMDESSHVRHRGTFLGVTEKLPHLKKLGINCVLLMPCTDFEECMGMDENVPVYTKDLKNKGTFKSAEKTVSKVRINYWGYGAEGLMFAPKASYASDSAHPEREFRTMVRRLHEEGIEVMMELSFPDRVTPDFVTEVCRFWVREYKIDGFRFVNMPVPDICISSDPYLADTVLVGSGWDEGRLFTRDEVPSFKNLAVMDDTFAMTVRRFLKGDEGMTSDFAGMLTRNNSRSGYLNCITDCNGFTLNDLFTYEVKHNEANGENNRDGNEINYSWNCGHEGDDNGRKIPALRLSMVKNALIALLSAQGTPMLLAGDEFLNSQQGNNNAYCQDNPTSWLNWKNTGKARELTDFTAGLIALRKNHPTLHNREPLRMMDYVSYGCPDLSYHGIAVWGPDFSFNSRHIGILLNGQYARFRDGKADKGFYILFNMYREARDFDLPSISKKQKWEVVCFGSTGKLPTPGTVVDRRILLPARSAIVLREH